MAKFDKSRKYFSCVLLSAMTMQQPYLVAAKEEEKLPLSALEQESYTINFTNVAIGEYLRFVSKITGYNFIFKEQDLPFTVTIVSEEPVTAKNVMSTLIQVLRAHNLMLYEQDNNYLITTSPSVSQLAEIVSPESGKSDAALITRIFRVRNVNPNTLADILRPMVSMTASIEVSLETKQLIVTDITTNIEKIAQLLENLDAPPHSSLEVDSYTALNLPPDELILIATQIITPFAEGVPLSMVTQPQTNTIFVVSTPALIERALTVLNDLDMPQKGAGRAFAEDIFVYKIEHQSSHSLLRSLEQIVSEMEEMHTPPKELIHSLKSVKWIKESNSLFFVADPLLSDKIRSILASLDISPSKESSDQERVSFYIYKLQQATYDQMQSSLKQMTHNLEESNVPDQGIIDAVKSMVWIPESNSVIFSGPLASLNKLSTILPTFDVVSHRGAFGGKGSFAPNQFLTYNPQYRSGEDLKKALEEMSTNLQASGLTNSAFLQTVESMRWIPTTNTLLFTGDQSSLDRIGSLLTSMDAPLGSLNPQLDQGQYTFFIYELQYVPGNDIVAELELLASKLDLSQVTNRSLSETIHNIQWIEQRNSLVISGPTKSVDRLKQLIAQFDGIGPNGTLSAAQMEAMMRDIEAKGGKAGSKYGIQHIGKESFLLFKPQHVSTKQMMDYLREVGRDLKRAGLTDDGVINVIENMRLVKESNSIMLTGPEFALTKVANLAEQYDVSAAGSGDLQKFGERKIPSAQERPSEFMIYNPQYIPGEDLLQIVYEFEQNLLEAGVENQDLYDTVDNLKWIPRTSSILISGSPSSIAKTYDLLIKFDVPPEGVEETEGSLIDNTNFFVYKLQYHQGNEIQQALKQIGNDLLATSTTSSPAQEELLHVINSLQWIQMTNSLLSTGDPEALRKLNQLIRKLDVPLRQVFIEVLVIITNVNNTQSFGLEWAGKGQFQNKLAASLGNTVPSPSPLTNAINQINASTFPNPAQIPVSGGLDFGVIGDIILHKGRSFISLGSLVNALQTDSDSTVVMNPKIIAQDNKNSTIFVGSNVPFVGSVITSTEQNQQSTTSIEYRNVGTNLSITPVLGEGDVVTLEITNEISALTSGAPAILAGEVSGLLTTLTTMNTRVHIPDQHFLVLSGMISDSNERGKTGIPCLGGLPVIGAAFSTTNRSANKQNVLFFIRPTIINSYDDYKKVTETQESLAKETSVLPILQEEFDAVLDWIKRPEDE